MDVRELESRVWEPACEMWEPVCGACGNLCVGHGSSSERCGIPAPTSSH